MWRSVAYGTLFNSCSYKTLALNQIFFNLMLQLVGTFAIMGRESHDSTLLHELTGSHVAYRTHIGNIR